MIARAWGTTPWELREQATVGEHRAMCDVLTAEWRASNRTAPDPDDD